MKKQTKKTVPVRTKQEKTVPDPCGRGEIVVRDGQRYLLRQGQAYLLLPDSPTGSRSMVWSDDRTMLEAAAAHLNTRMFAATHGVATDYPAGPFFVERSMIHTAWRLDFAYPATVSNFLDLDQIERMARVFVAGWVAARSPRRRK